MPKFKKKVVRRQFGGPGGPSQNPTPEQVPDWLKRLFQPGIAGIEAKNKILQAAGESWNRSGNLSVDDSSKASSPDLPGGILSQPTSESKAGNAPVSQSISAAIPPPRTQRAGISRTTTPIPSIDQNKMNAMLMAAAKPKSGIPDLIASSSKSTVPGITALGMGNPLAGLPGAPESEGETTEGRDIAKMSDSGKGSIAKEIPKTKAGMKKFVQDYGKYIALGAMAGQGGKAGQIAAPIIAAIPGLIEMMRKKKDTTAEKKAKGGTMKKAAPAKVSRKFIGGFTQRMLPKLLEKLEASGDKENANAVRQYISSRAPQKGSLKSTPPDIKVIGEEPDENQYSKGGAIRKFKGGSMNKMDKNVPTKKEMLTPKYKKGGSTGVMGQHKLMAMGKPTPQSTGQKFAKGGTMKCATGGVTKGYGISKKIKPSGPMC